MTTSVTHAVRDVASGAPSVRWSEAPVPPPASRWRFFDPRQPGGFARLSFAMLRVSLGLVFVWFGVIKFFPDLSPAQDLATRTMETLTFGMLGPSVSLAVLALWECLIGVGLISGRYLRATLALLLVQMAGTFTPLVLFPGETWVQFPVVPSMEGQYILKNLVLVSAALVIGAVALSGHFRRAHNGATR
jgi:uncharacterized membrane protein YphA (DoxX/SURF4 family)